MANKPTVAFFDFASCEGCQVELTNLGSSAFIELLKHIELVEFREVMSEKTKQPIDIACIEGAFTRESDRQRLESIRQRAKIVISYGQCASQAGITALKNHQDDYKETVYQQSSSMPHLQSTMATPISSAIKVDFEVLGCPINKEEFIAILSHLIHNTEPIIPNFPVCVECKRNETICQLLIGEPCLGMLAKAGCGAPCPADGIPCDACRGYIDKPNTQAIDKILIKHAKFTPERAKSYPLMFNNIIEKPDIRLEK